MYVCVCVCVCVRVCVHVYVCVYVCMCTNSCMVSVVGFIVEDLSSEHENGVGHQRNI